MLKTVYRGDGPGITVEGWGMTPMQDGEKGLCRRASSETAILSSWSRVTTAGLTSEQAYRLTKLIFSRE